MLIWIRQYVRTSHMLLIWKNFNIVVMYFWCKLCFSFYLVFYFLYSVLCLNYFLHNLSMTYNYFQCNVQNTCKTSLTGVDLELTKLLNWTGQTEVENMCLLCQWPYTGGRHQTWINCRKSMYWWCLHYQYILCMPSSYKDIFTSFILEVIFGLRLVVGLVSEYICVQKEDCAKGVVFDGLESLYTASLYSSAQSLLTAINNRTHIFAVGLKMDYSVIKQNERRAEEEKGKWYSALANCFVIQCRPCCFCPFHLCCCIKRCQ